MLWSLTFFSNSFQNHGSEPSDLPTTFLYDTLPLLLWGSVGIFVLCASNLIRISLALIIKPKLKPALTFRSGFEATCHLGEACCKPFPSARAVVCLQSCGATQRQARPGGKSMAFSTRCSQLWFNFFHGESDGECITKVPQWSMTDWVDLEVGRVALSERTCHVSFTTKCAENCSSARVHGLKYLMKHWAVWLYSLILLLDFLTCFINGPFTLLTQG